MYTNIEFPGFFFLPSNEKEQISGKLKFDANSSIEIEMLGSFSNNQGDLDILHFVSVEYLEFTLCNCRCYDKSDREASWDARYAIQGYLFNRLSDLKFSSIILSIEDLNQWLDFTGFNFGKRSSYKKTIIEYVQPKPLKFKIDSKVSGRFCFNTRHITYPIYKIGVQETVLLKIESNAIKKTPKIDIANSMDTNSHIPFLDLLQYSNRFLSFLTLAKHQSVKILNIQLESKDITRTTPSNIEMPITMQVSFDIYTNNSASKKSLKPLFFYKDIKSDINKIIPKWFLNYEKLEPVFNLLLDSYHNNLNFNENNFLNIAQAIETFHRRTRNNKKMRTSMYNKLSNEIKLRLSDKQFSLVKDYLNFGNEPTLHSRLENLLSEFKISMLDKMILDKTIFIRNVKNSRNYYTHYSVDLEKKALKGSELYYLTEKLKIFLVILVMRQVGFSFISIENIFKKNSSKIYHLYNK